MNHEKLLRRLAACARRERCPQVNVAGRVMAAIYAGQGVATPAVDALVWVAVASLALAVPAAVLAFTGTQTWVDPLMAALVDLPGWMI